MIIIPLCFDLFQDLQSHSLDQYMSSVPKKYLRPNSDVRGQPQYKFDSPPAQRLTRAVGDWILMDGLPVSAVEGEGLRQMLGVFDPRYVIPSRPWFAHVICALFLL
jgi:hypothetical protein